MTSPAPVVRIYFWSAVSIFWEPFANKFDNYNKQTHGNHYVQVKHNMATECNPHYNRYTLLSRSSMNCYSVNFSPEIVLRVSGNRFRQLSDSSMYIRYILYSISFIWASSWFSRLQRRHQCLCPMSWQWIQSRVHLNWLLQIIIVSAFTSPNHCC